MVTLRAGSFDLVPDPRPAFGDIVDSYDRSRPDYPIDAVHWLSGIQPRRVLELGAGTGKLTAALVAQGHEVLATEPDPVMLAALTDKIPDAFACVAAAESIPMPDHSVDVVVAAQCAHWFDLDRAIPEINRVLAPGGVFSLVWNERDEAIPWVRRLGAILGNDGGDTMPRLAGSPYFEPFLDNSFRHWSELTRDELVDLVVARAYVSGLSAGERDRRIADVRTLFDAHATSTRVRLPYVTRCYRAVARHPEPDPDAELEDPGTLLIDFR